MEYSIIHHKKEYKFGKCYNTGETWKYARWNKPDTKEQTLYDSIYMTCPE